MNEALPHCLGEVAIDLRHIFYLSKKCRDVIGARMRAHVFAKCEDVVKRNAHAVRNRLKLDENGQVISRKVMCIGSAADHDILDGMGLARFAYLFTQLVESSAGLDDAFVAQTRRLIQGDNRDRIYTAQRS